MLRQKATRDGDDPARWRDQVYPGNYQSQVQRAIAFGGVEHDFFVAGKAHWLARFMHRYGIAPGSVSAIDIGCGIGLLHRYLRGLASTLVGVDVSADAIAEARQLNPDMSYKRYDGVKLPFDDAEFDLALAVTVMHHVPVSKWFSFVLDAQRILKPGGAFVIIEHNPLNPLTRYAVNRCEFDADAVLLSARRASSLLQRAEFNQVGCDHIFFTPFKAKLVQELERRIAWLPLGAQYAAYGFKRN